MRNWRDTVRSSTVFAGPSSHCYSLTPLSLPHTTGSRASRVESVWKLLSLPSGLKRFDSGGGSLVSGAPNPLLLGGRRPNRFFGIPVDKSFCSLTRGLSHAQHRGMTRETKNQFSLIPIASTVWRGANRKCLLARRARGRACEEARAQVWGGAQKEHRCGPSTKREGCSA